MRDRNRFFNKLKEYALKDDRVILLYGDIGGEFLDEWQSELPKQTINCMTAEQNMILVAAGLAQQGFKPFCYSIIPFLLFRPYEMIRIYLSDSRLPVRLVGIYADNDRESEGYTHWAQGDKRLIEDLNIQVPTEEPEELAEKAYFSNQPMYIRLKR